jgi:outer membrane protein assembly factor BamA
VVYLPAVRLTSETGFGLGGKILREFYLARKEGAVPSDVQLKGEYTFKGQKRIELVTNLRSCNDCYSLKATARYDDLALRFWGLGPDTPAENEEIYRPRDLRAYVEILRRLHSPFKLGLRYEFEHFRIIQKEPTGLLATSAVPGLGGKHVFGAGVTLDYDTRDRFYSPTRGSYYQFFSMWFDEHLGSDYDFNVYNLDLRNYFRLAEQHILATQIFLYAAMGDAPFWRYAALGGRHHTRGYRKGRFLDHTLLAFQGEYRFPVWRQCSGVLFGGLGDVAPKLGQLRLETMRATAGAGLRFQPKPDHFLKMRLDMAAGAEGMGSMRFYLGLDEAF